jgi:hypothetical protein
MGTYPTKFTQIIGGRLLEVGTTNSSYNALENKESPKYVVSPRLEFDIGVLTIENPFILQNGTTHLSSTDSLINSELNKLVGKCVVDSVYENDSIVVRFETGASIIISLRDEDYNSPEAGNFVPRVGSTIMFN